MADCVTHPWLELLAATVTAGGGVIVALLTRIRSDTSRIRGLLNGTRQSALAEIETLYRQRVDAGAELRRHVDQVLAEGDEPHKNL